MRRTVCDTAIRFKDIAVTSLAVLLSGCQDESVVPTVQGMKLEYVVPGTRISPIVVRGDTAFMAVSDNSMQALSVSTGRVLWTTRLREGGGEYFLSEIAVTRDLIVAGLAGGVVAVRRRDGSIAWRYTADPPDALATAGIATDSTYVAFAQTSNRATILDAQTGAVVWSRSLVPGASSGFSRSPTIGDGIVTFGRDGETADAPDGEILMQAFRVTDGLPLWSITVSRDDGLDHWASLRSLRLGSTMYFALRSGRVVSVARQTGQVRWISEKPTGEPGSVRYFASSGAEVIAAFDASPGGAESFDAASGTVNWRYESTTGSPSSPLAVGTSLMAFSSFGGQLALVDRATRTTRVIWPEEMKVNGSNATFFPTPTFVGDLLLAPTSAGLLGLRRVR